MSIPLLRPFFPGTARRSVLERGAGSRAGVTAAPRMAWDAPAHIRAPDADPASAANSSSLLTHTLEGSRCQLEGKSDGALGTWV